MRLAALLAFAPLLMAVGAHAATTTPLIHSDVLMQADEVDYDVDAQIVTARGHVEIDTSGRILLADTVSYDQKNDLMTADGHVSVTDEKGNVAFASHVVLTDKMRDGALRNFAALIGKNGRMVAASATRTQGRFTEAFDASYTPCKICNQPGQRTPVWKVRADHVIYDQVKHRIVFRGAALEFFDVPLFYTPYLQEPDPSVRYASGILTPDLGNSTNIGYFVKLPIYIAITPSQDATITPLVSTRGGAVLAGEYRQRLQGGGLWLQASVADNPNGGITEEQNEFYSSLFGSGRIPFSTNWRTGFDLQLTSNDTYLKRYDFLQLDRLVNDLFVEGTGGRTRFAVTGYFFQGLRASDRSAIIPFALPLIEFSYIPLHKILGGQFRFDVTSIALTRNVGEDDQRFSSEVRMSWPTVLPGGQLFTVEMDVRGDLYHLSNVLTPGDDKYISRGIPYAAIDWRWPFISSAGQGRAFIIEPIAQFVLQPYGGNPAGIPNEDSAAFDLDDNNVLSFDQMPGYDLVESGPRANVGMHARAVFPSGSVDAVFGETFRFKPDPIFVNSAPQDGTASDLVGRVSVKFLPFIDLTDRIDIDRDNGTVRRHEVYLTGTWNRSSLQISYVQLPQTTVSVTPTLSSSACELPLDPALACIPERQELTAQADVNFYQNWQVFGALRRDLLAGEMLDTELGLGYEDECLGISVAYRRKFTTDRDLPPSTSIILRFNLKTGDQPIEPFSLFPQDVFSHP
ncbi:MAG: LPS-assembly protein LptD [Alphaproteobacteria bacterium]|nr:LPS-assembly protein LptD [Alphaproteobacteria bacterium]MBL6939948.1 LPS-assembly protein LptD [Alphaproteobacteria bacterium]MBL7099866.1 LPS-assembly protein LptD [Alphaproteobacteria bacterium]